MRFFRTPRLRGDALEGQKVLAILVGNFEAEKLAFVQKMQIFPVEASVGGSYGNAQCLLSNGVKVELSYRDTASQKLFTTMRRDQVGEADTVYFIFDEAKRSSFDFVHDELHACMGRIAHNRFKLVAHNPHNEDPTVLQTEIDTLVRDLPGLTFARVSDMNSARNIMLSHSAASLAERFPAVPTTAEHLKEFPRVVAPVTQAAGPPLEENNTMTKAAR